MKPSPERIQELSLGLDEARNLMESLAIDYSLLIKTTLPNLSIPPIDPKLGITKKMKLLGSCLYEQNGFHIFEYLKAHRSDTLRSLACYLLSEHNLSLQEKLNLIKPLADDSNSGVREFAWMALRENIAEDISLSIKLLEPLTLDSSDKIRRFSSESSRPRGVWCQHIRTLRNAPWQGLPLLEPLKDDSSRYVQLSVGNWLNDAGKDHPQWVIDLCRSWKEQSPTSNTEKICKRALRNLS